MEEPTRLTADVLVVGGGIAGCWAAIRARQRGASVCVLDKGPAGKTGAAKFASGDIRCFMPTDSSYEWVEEMVVGGDYLSDQRWIEVALQESLQRVEEMDRFGVKFEKTDGSYRREPGRGRVSLSVVFNGAQMMEAMRRETERQGARVLDRVFTDELLISDGRPGGAIGVNTRNGRVFLVEAKAVILANGACTLRANYFGQHFSTGEAYRMAYDCGARLRGMEAIAWNSSSRDYDTTGMSRFTAMGGRFRNRLGEPFMERYYPAMKDRAPVNWVVVAMAREVSEGRGPIYFDLTALTEEHHALSRKLIPWGTKLFERAGIDITKDRIEWIPSFQGTQGSAAGIAIDLDGRTNVEGLFATGDAGAWLSHGLGTGWGGSALANCIVLGARAGVTAADYALGITQPKTDAGQVRAFEETFFTPLSRQSGPLPDEVLFEIQSNVFPAEISVLKEANRLEKALRQLDRVEDDLIPNVATPDVHELIKAHETECCLFYAKAMLMSALYRQETRGVHVREDYPHRDNRDWLKWTYLQRQDNRMNVWAENVPEEAWKYVPAPTS
ncbi:MAG: FAD-binding protein [Chloroflexi bacterium]|nr:FAD-binding protein [Chloroflexota bacterium]